jgi:hypothetical protein
VVPANTVAPRAVYRYVSRPTDDATTGAVGLPAAKVYRAGVCGLSGRSSPVTDDPGGSRGGSRAGTSENTLQKLSEKGQRMHPYRCVAIVVLAT